MNQVKKQKSKMSLYRKVIVFLIILFLIAISYSVISLHSAVKALSTESSKFWPFQSIDTMKYSRDLSREKLSDPTFDLVIDEQVKNIAETGATHIAIATPYDDEFLPILTRWVKAARRYNLNVWFRGNFSGWEKWFDYEGISREEHIAQTKRFIENNASLFENGDVFSACPECENGGPGDPRNNGDVAGHRKFLIDEYAVTKQAFKKINRAVESNYNSMNGDVARLIMDKETTKKLDGLVVIDHYVPTVSKMKKDLEEISSQSGGKIVLGEFGAPIPDLNGDMTEEEQEIWLKDTLHSFIQTNTVVGVNYWVNIGGSTQLWNEDGTQRKAVKTLSTYFLPTLTTVIIENPLGQKITNAQILIDGRTYSANANAQISIPKVLLPSENVTIQAKGYTSKTGSLDTNAQLIVMEKSREDIAYKLMKLLHLTLNIPTSK